MLFQKLLVFQALHKLPWYQLYIFTSFSVVYDLLVFIDFSIAIDIAYQHFGSAKLCTYYNVFFLENQ